METNIKRIDIDKAYKSGAASRQAEIDELQAMYKKQGLYAFELQKRIDEALRELMVYKNIQTAVVLLKGKENEK